MEIIDFHTHIYPEKIAAKAVSYIGDFYKLNMECDGLAASLSALAKKGIVNRFVLLPVAMNANGARSINDFIIETCRIDSAFIGFATLHPDMEDMDGALSRVTAAGLCGVKFHPDMQQLYIDERKMYPIYEAIAGKLPVVFHAGDARHPYSHPARIARVLRDFPKLTVIASHFGGYSVYNEAKAMLQNERCYIDTSSSLPFLSKKQARGLIDAYGSERVLFGSDFPMWNPAGELERFLSLDLGDSVNERILSGNAKRLLHI